ncbi:MAG: class I SAM-dependent methyltransferase [Proteobacteria bacterium]|nr:class I SAM-dependent methyltransferase [Pseudomonadota bacterium]
MLEETKEKKSWNEHEGELIGHVNGFDVIDCANCSFKHIIPIPTAEALEVTYKDEYYSKEKPLYLDRAEEDKDWWKLVNSERYELFESFLDTPRRRILEIGSGPGFFLLEGKERGWETLGFEPSTKAAAHASEMGLNIVNDFLTEENSKELGVFDVIYMHEVLEHLPEPQTFMRIVNSLLAPGGLVSVIVPNDYNPFQRVLNSTLDFAPWWVAPPHHINYFNNSSLSSLLEFAGIEVISSETTFPIDIFLLMGENYVGNDKVGRECHERRKNFEMNLERAGLSALKRSIYESFAKHGLGREIVLLGRKT